MRYIKNLNARNTEVKLSLPITVAILDSSNIHFRTIQMKVKHLLRCVRECGYRLNLKFFTRVVSLATIRLACALVTVFPVTYKSEHLYICICMCMSMCAFVCMCVRVWVCVRARVGVRGCVAGYACACGRFLRCRWFNVEEIR